MQDTALLFDESQRHLGEVALRDGALGSFTLSQAGEQLLGESVKDWQTMGIPIMRETMQEIDGGSRFSMAEDHVQVRDGEFGDALRRWFFERHYHVVPLTAQVLPFWEKLVALPLKDAERFAMLYEICKLPTAALADWKLAIDEAYAAVKKVT